MFVRVLCLAALLALASGQAIRNYTAEELYPGQICADDGTPWEGLTVGPCPQGYNGIRAWAKAQGLVQGRWVWPPCDPCKPGQVCFEFKPGVGKCTVPAYNTSDNVLTFLKEGETCLDFSGGKGKWHPVNKDLFSKSCEWPYFSCNNVDPSNPDLYVCERVRDAQRKPVKSCYRAAGSRWWGGTDQVYYYQKESGQFKPCGGPNPDYPACPFWCTLDDPQPSSAAFVVAGAPANDAQKKRDADKKKAERAAGRP